MAVCRDSAGLCGTATISGCVSLARPSPVATMRSTSVAESVSPKSALMAAMI